MSRLVWDQIGQKLYETGADQAVLYPIDEANEYSKGVAWNGLIGVDENPSGAEPSKIYADNINYITLYSAEEYGFTIRTYTYPDEFEECNGEAELAKGVLIGQQTRKSFGFAYRTLVGNDTKGNDFGYKLHLCYGCRAGVSSETHDTVNDSPAANEMSYECTCTPVPVKGYKPTCVVEIDTTKLENGTENTKLKTLEGILYGSDTDTARLPLPDEINTIFK